MGGFLIFLVSFFFSFPVLPIYSYLDFIIIFYPYLDYIIFYPSFLIFFFLYLWSGGIGRGAELPSTMNSGQAGINSFGDRLLDLQNNPLDIENIINNSIGNRNQMNKDSNSVFKSKYISQLNGFASS